MRIGNSSDSGGTVKPSCFVEIRRRSILLSLEPAFAALFGWILLGPGSGVLRNLAIALVILASVGVTLTRPRRQASEKPAGPRRHGGHHPAGASEAVEAVPAGFRQSATETEGWDHATP